MNRRWRDEILKTLGGKGEKAKREGKNQESAGDLTSLKAEAYPK
jgi:hypothetical protein